MSKFDLDFKGFLDFAYKIDELAGAEGLKKATENALIATDKYLTPQIETAMTKAKVVNLRKGKVNSINWDRTGNTKRKIDKEYVVDWDGTTASIGVGFKDTPIPIILALGTPYIGGDSGLYTALKGKGKHRKIIDKIQQEEFTKVLNEVMRND